jgi:hypothetical protein
MEMSLKSVVLSCLFGLTLAQFPHSKQMENMRKQFPIGSGLNVQRRVDGNIVLGTQNDGGDGVPPLPDFAAAGIDSPTRFDPSAVPSSVDDQLSAINNEIGALNALEPAVVVEPEEPGFVDSILGDGAQSRIIESLQGWVVSKAKSNPGCVERFVCETYRTGETLNGAPYLAFSLTNAAVSFMVADMFDQSVDLKEITKAARHGRTIGSCHNMNCDVIDSQLRNLESVFEIVENFVTTIYNSVAGSLPFR